MPDRLPRRTLKCINANPRGSDPSTTLMLPNIELSERDSFGEFKAENPVYVYPTDAAPDALEAILRKLPLKFQWEEDTGLYEVKYPDKMRQQAAKEWRLRFPFRHLTWTNVEEAIDADPALAEFIRPLAQVGGGHGAH